VVERADGSSIRPTPLGVGVIGFGWMGQVHARAHLRLLQHFPDAPRRPRLVAVADTDASRREEALTAYGFEHAYAAWQDLLERDDVEAVSVCGPNFVHREIAVAAARAGKHVWVEKPAGRNLADTAEIAEAVHVAGVQSAVGFNYRHAPAIQRARELVGAGRLGRVETVRTFLSSDYAAHPDGALSWRFDPQYAGTGVLGDLASHGLDLAAYVLGKSAGDITELVADQATFITERPEPTGVVSHFSTASGGKRGQVGNEDQVSVLFRYASGARGVMECSRVAVGDQCRYGIEIRGDNGALAWDFRRMGELQVCLDQDYLDASWQTRLVTRRDGALGAFQPGAGIAMGYDDLKVVEAEHFVRSIAEKRPIGATIDDMVATAALIEAITTSYDERRWVAPTGGNR
jgi:predicted dehydrogenase